MAERSLFELAEAINTRYGNGYPSDWNTGLDRSIAREFLRRAANVIEPFCPDVAQQAREAACDTSPFASDKLVQALNGVSGDFAVRSLAKSVKND